MRCCSRRIVPCSSPSGPAAGASRVPRRASPWPASSSCRRRRRSSPRLAGLRSGPPKRAGEVAGVFHRPSPIAPPERQSLAMTYEPGYEIYEPPVRRPPRRRRSTLDSPVLAGALVVVVLGLVAAVFFVPGIRSPGARCIRPTLGCCHGSGPKRRPDVRPPDPQPRAHVPHLHGPGRRHAELDRPGSSTRRAAPSPGGTAAPIPSSTPWARATTRTRSASAGCCSSCPARSSTTPTRRRSRPAPRPDPTYRRPASITRCRNRCVRARAAA